MKTYSLRAGGVAERIVEYLREHGEATTAVLADAIDSPSTGIPSCTEAAVRAGLLAKEKRNGLTYWRLGDGKPVKREKDEPLNLGARKPPAPLTDGVDIDKVLHGTPGTTMRDLTLYADEAIEHPHSEFACAIFSDGRLVLEFDGVAKLILDADQTRELCRYLDRIAEPA